MAKMRKLLEIEGSDDALSALLREDSGLAQREIRWGLLGKNKTEPLHYVSDCVFNSFISDESAGRYARILLQHGAAVNGLDGAETPLIGATSLGASEVAMVLLDAGATIEPPSRKVSRRGSQSPIGSSERSEALGLFGANALHWAAFVGLPDVVVALLTPNIQRRGAKVETRCEEFGASALFWAVQGFVKDGRASQVKAAEILLEAGADLSTRNRDGVSALIRSKEGSGLEMARLLERFGAMR